MRRSKSIIAVCLTAALAVSGMVTPAQGNAAVKKSTDKAAVAATGSAVEVAASGAAAALKKDIDAFNAATGNMEDTWKLRVQHSELASPQDQMSYFATNVLGAKNSKLKYSIEAIDSQKNGELFVLTGKKLSIYDYDFKMMSEDYKAKPVVVIKNVKEVRIKSTKKGLFTVKTKKSKTVSYVTYKYDFEKATKKAVYSATGKTYKKGAKKISSKAFKKYLKSYKKQTLVEMNGTETAEYLTGYDNSEFMYLQKDYYVVNGKYDKIGQKAEGWTVIRHDADDKENPYKVFGAAEYDKKYRFVFGDDEKDWNYFRSGVVNIATFISPLADALEGKTMEVFVNEYLSKTNDTVYGLSFKPEDGAEADYGYNVHVDESGNTPLFRSVDLMTSAGVITEKWDFLYSTAADVDGEMYEPGSDSEVYADADYVKAVGCKTRTLKYDVAGTAKEAKTIDTVAFVLCTFTGKFSGTINGKKVDDMTSDNILKNELFTEVFNALNPKEENGNFKEPAVTDLKWTADALK